MQKGSLEDFDRLLNECTAILGEQYLTFGIKPQSAPDDALHRFNDYAQQYVNEENGGYIQILLTMLKPYKDNPIVSDLWLCFVNTRNKNRSK